VDDSENEDFDRKALENNLFSETIFFNLKNTHWQPSLSNFRVIRDDMLFNFVRET
jgi:hypothetical protein